MRLVGWKAIGKAWGFEGESIDTTRRRARRYEMPLLYIDTRPTIEREILEKWWSDTLKKVASATIC
jgi:hypothetical protein